MHVTSHINGVFHAEQEFEVHFSLSWKPSLPLAIFYFFIILHIFVNFRSSLGQKFWNLVLICSNTIFLPICTKKLDLAIFSHGAAQKSLLHLTTAFTYNPSAAWRQDRAAAIPRKRVHPNRPSIVIFCQSFWGKLA